MRSLAGITVVVDATTAFYRDAMNVLQERGLRFLVGGSHALVHYTGIARHTKDFDLFVLRSEIEAVLRALESIGCRTEVSFPHWLAKAFRSHDVIDLIYCSGNGVAEVDESWFTHAPEADVLGLRVRLSPVEEMIWQKALIMERERFDGADVAHLLLAQASAIDWPRLVARFGVHWRILLVHLILFGFIYPGEGSRLPPDVLAELLERLHRASDEPAPDAPVTQGTLLSRAQYLVDLERGYRDARLDPPVGMRADEIAHWTRAIEEEAKNHERNEKPRSHRRRR